MNFPTNPKPNSIKITSISPTLVSLTHSLKRQARRRGGQRWLLDIDFPPMTREQFLSIWAFSIAQQGQFKTFNYIPIIYGSTSGTLTGDLTVSGAYNAGISAVSVNIDGNGNFEKGDFIKFNNHDKVYMITGTASIFNTWTEGSCDNPNYLNEIPCEAAVNTWTDGSCSDPDYTNETSCLAAVNRWEGVCSDPAYTDEASCLAGTNSWTPIEIEGYCVDTRQHTQANCTTVGRWINSECAVSFSSNIVSVKSRCLELRDAFYHYKYVEPYFTGTCSDPDYSTETSCLDAVNTWSPTNVCSDPDYLDETSCLAAVNTWTDGTCSNTIYTDEALCLAGTNTWTPIQECSDPAYTDKETCESSEKVKVAQITFEPALHIAVPHGEPIIYNDVPFHVAFAKDTTDMRVKVNELVAYKISLVEIA